MGDTSNLPPAAAKTYTGGKGADVEMAKNQPLPMDTEDLQLPEWPEGVPVAQVLRQFLADWSSTKDGDKLF